jgi:GDPmannose 4,6-dehydratase
LDERGIDVATGRDLIRVDPAYYRPTEVDILLGDSSKARTELKWAPKVSFSELVKEMVLADIDMVKKGSRL